jgi:hypothetical protein
MSSSSFTLRVPADGAYPTLAGAVGARWLEMNGASADAASRFEADIVAAAAALATGADAIDCTFSSGPEGVEATLQAGSCRQIVRQSRS